jgi:hypothetical protein
MNPATPTNSKAGTGVAEIVIVDDSASSARNFS